MAMERDHIATLIAQAHEKDALLQLVPTETRREVFCTVGSIQQSEFFAAGRSGLKAQMRLTVFAEDYRGEELVEVDGVKYEIYRTYLGDNERLELYLKKRGGG